MSLFPTSAKEHWAESLGAPGKNGKSLKAITALRDIWPKVNVGWWNASTRTMVDYDENLEDEYGELEVVKRLISEEEAEAITPEEILAAFNTVSS